MRKFGKYISIAVLLVICIMMWLLVFVGNYVPAQIRNQAAEGEPYQFMDSSELPGGIDAIAACDNYLYLLDDGKAILRVYDLDGEYLHSYCFPKYQKGMGSVFTYQDKVYFKDKSNNFYTLENGKVTSFEKHTEEMMNAKRESENTPVVSGDAVFKIQGASVWKIMKDGTQTEIIHRPGWMAVYQGNTFMYIFGVGFLCVWVLFVLKKKNIF